MLDTPIKNARVVDGTGRASYRGHVGIQGGVIRHVGRADPGGATRVIDADGLVVAPGFIDPHTHLDAQVLWDRQLTPSCCDDLPAGGRRLIARAHGIVATFVRGVQVMREGTETGALPGGAIRSTEAET